MDRVDRGQVHEIAYSKNPLVGFLLYSVTFLAKVSTFHSWLCVSFLFNAVLFLSLACFLHRWLGRNIFFNAILLLG